MLQSLVPKYSIYSPHGVFPTIPLESPVTLLWGMDISGLSHVNDYQMFKINQLKVNCTEKLE